MYRYRCTWSAFTGAPGYTNFYSDGTNLNTGLLKAFFQAMTRYFPAGLTISFPDSADVIDDATGMLLGSVPALHNDPVVSATAAGPYAGASGAIVDWQCGSERVAGRLVRGRTFLVPLIDAAYSNTGTLDPAAQGNIKTYADNLLAGAGPHLVVWARPKAAQVLPKRPHPARAGSQHIIQTSSVPAIQAQLRSRRT